MTSNVLLWVIASVVGIAGIKGIIHALGCHGIRLFARRRAVDPYQHGRRP